MTTSSAAAALTQLQVLFEQRLLAPAAPGLPFTFVRTADLATVRRRVQAHTAAAALSADAAYNLTLAVHELAVDALTYGGGAGTLLLGRERAALVCEVRDSRPMSVPATVPRHPPLNHSHRRGLWLANQLCDLVEVRSGSWGTAARITTWL
jgi:anti-sigma regulatory factor (Ser/Thr protein kinase)